MYVIVQDKGAYQEICFAWGKLEMTIDFQKKMSSR